MKKETQDLEFTLSIANGIYQSLFDLHKQCVDKGTISDLMYELSVLTLDMAEGTNTFNAFKQLYSEWFNHLEKNIK